jgi:hypothetical protein
MKNTIIPIPNILTKVFINFESTDPYSVANAFFDQMKEPKTHDQEDNDDQSTADIEVNQTILLDQDTTGNLSPENKDDSDPGSEGNQSTLNKTSSNPPTRILSCDPILSFMSKRKDPPGTLHLTILPGSSKMVHLNITQFRPTSQTYSVMKIEIYHGFRIGFR